ncbi:MAG: DUF1877 family protein [Bacteroidota bacterium]
MGVRVSYHRVSLACVMSLRESVEAMRRFVYFDVEESLTQGVDIDKAWDGLHYLLDPARRATCCDHPQTTRGRMVLGGEVVNATFSKSDDFMARVLSPPEIQHAVLDLALLTESDLYSTMDWQAMMNHPDPNMRVYGPHASQVFDPDRGESIVVGKDG